MAHDGGCPAQVLVVAVTAHAAGTEARGKERRGGGRGASVLVLAVALCELLEGMHGRGCGHGAGAPGANFVIVRVVA